MDYLPVLSSSTKFVIIKGATTFNNKTLKEWHPAKWLTTQQMLLNKMALGKMNIAEKHMTERFWQNDTRNSGTW